MLICNFSAKYIPVTEEYQILDVHDKKLNCYHWNAHKVLIIIQKKLEYS